MAQAQSLHRLPCKGALWTSSAEQSVVPIHNMYESTSRVTCSASAGKEESDGARYLVSTEIVRVDVMSMLFKLPVVTVLASVQL